MAEPDRGWEPQGGWSALGASGLVGRALLVPRREIAYFKYLFESYEGLAIVRTVETLDRDRAVIAVLATPELAAEVHEILDDVERAGSPTVARHALPAACREDWFLEAWTREPPEG